MDYRTASEVDQSTILAAIEAGTASDPTLIRPADVDSSGSPMGPDVLIYTSARPEGVLVGICSWVELAQLLARAVTSFTVVSGAATGIFHGGVPGTVAQQEAEADAALLLEEVRLTGKLEEIQRKRGTPPVTLP